MSYKEISHVKIIVGVPQTMKKKENVKNESY